MFLLSLLFSSFAQAQTLPESPAAIALSQKEVLTLYSNISGRYLIDRTANIEQVNCQKEIKINPTEKSCFKVETNFEDFSSMGFCLKDFTQNRFAPGSVEVLQTVIPYTSILTVNSARRNLAENTYVVSRKEGYRITFDSSSLHINILGVQTSVSLRMFRHPDLKNRIRYDIYRDVWYQNKPIVAAEEAEVTLKRIDLSKCVYVHENETQPLVPCPSGTQFRQGTCEGNSGARLYRGRPRPASENLAVPQAKDSPPLGL